MSYELKESKINKQGIFTTTQYPKNIEIGLYVSTSCEKGVRYLFKPPVETQWYEIGMLGRYCNHSDNPNTHFSRIDNDIFLISNGISENEEITSDYNIVSEMINFPMDTTKFN